MPRLAALALLLFVCACKKGGDDAARERIFSPEQPVGTLPEAKEHIEAGQLAEDPNLARRVLHMSRKEIEQRLGGYRAQQRVQFAWFRGPGLPDGGTEVSLSEETTLVEGPDDEFSLKLVNDRNQGFEMVRANGEVFVKNLYGAFHKRRSDRTEPERVREQALSGLATFDRLARGLKLRNAGEATVEGRKVVRYTVTGFGARGNEKEKSELPALQYPDKGPDPDTARRLELWEKEEPASVRGTVVVDAQTGAPLGCDLQGRFKVPGAQGAAAELSLHSALVTSSVGKRPTIKAPEAEPETSVPHAVKDPLRFLGKAQGTEPEEPDETDEEEAPQQQR